MQFVNVTHGLSCSLDGDAMFMPCLSSQEENATIQVNNVRPPLPFLDNTARGNLYRRGHAVLNPNQYHGMFFSTFLPTHLYFVVMNFSSNFCRVQFCLEG